MACTAAVKSLLLRAWRERWSDMQWSVHVKRILTAHSASSEELPLAELLLQQALIGSSPNMLVISYLKHAVSTQVVTYEEVLKVIIKYNELGKPYCIKSILEVLEGFAPRMSSKGANEDTLPMCCALVGVLKWLLEMMLKFAQKVQENQQVAEYVTLLQKSCDIIEKLMLDKSTVALLHVALQEEKDTMHRLHGMEASINSTVAELQNAAVTADLKTRVTDSLKMLNSCTKAFEMEPRKILDVSFHPLNISINVLVTMEAVLNPTNEIQPLVEEILVLESLQGLSRPVLYCELLRACMMGLIDSNGGQDELKWAAFTLLKAPQVINRLMQTGDDTDRQAEINKLEQGLEKLLDYVPLLDLTDSKCSCNFLQYLLHELSKKYSLLNETTVNRLFTRRQNESQKPKKTEQAGQQQSPGLILRAEPTVVRILRTLDADYTKNQEGLLSVLCCMMSGKSFELILGAAAATGKIQNLAAKLVKFNELSKQTPGEAGKAAQDRAMIFDISFLMLCHIAQFYGTEIVTSCHEYTSSFFVQWVLTCMPEDGKYKSLDSLAPPDQNKVEALLGQINPGCEIKTGLARWHEVCHNIPYAMQEVLFAWEHGALTQDNIRSIIDNVKDRMCCLSVVVSAWLCSYINLSDEKARQKPMNLLQQLMLATVVDPMATPTEYYTERSQLMHSIVNRMVQGLLPPSSTSRALPYTLPTGVPALDTLTDTYKTIFQQGCIDILSVYKMEHLLNVGGAHWFCEHLVKEALSHERPEELSKGVSLTYGLFHLDLENLTLALLHHVVPSLLQAPATGLKLVTDPRGKALAQMCVMCLTVLHTMKQLPTDASPVKRGRKRTRTELELEDTDEADDGRASKLRKISQDDSLTEGFAGLTDIFISKEEPEDVPTYDTKDPINRALVNMMKLFSSNLSQNEVSPRTGFILAFIQETIKAGNPTAAFVLQFMPKCMVAQLMKSLPKESCTKVLIHLCDLSSLAGRKIAAKVISQSAKLQLSERKSC